MLTSAYIFTWPFSTFLTHPDALVLFPHLNAVKLQTYYFSYFIKMRNLRANILGSVQSHIGT